MPVAVIGMHRSGTSMVARLLNLAGVDLGDTAAMLPPTQFNQEGHWENTAFIHVNDGILQWFGGSWDRPPCFPQGWYNQPGVEPFRVEASEGISRTFAGKKLWGWKDPRTTLTLPFWQRVVPDLRYVVCIRNPLDVAASLESRDAMPTDAAIDLWQLYTELALTNTDPRHRIIVHYDEFFSDPRHELDRLVHFLELPATEMPTQRDGMQASIAANLAHHRHSFEEMVRSPDVPAATRLLYDCLLYHPETIDRLFNHRPVDEPVNRLVPMMERDSRMRDELRAVSSQLAELRPELGRKETQLRDQIGRSERQAAQLRNRDQLIERLEAQVERLALRLENTSAQLRTSEAVVAETRAQAAESRHYAERLLGSLEEHERLMRAEIARHENLEAEMAARHGATMREMSTRLAEWQEHWTRVQSTVAWSAVENLRRFRRLFFPEQSRLEWLWFHALRRDVPRNSEIASLRVALPAAAGPEAKAAATLPPAGRSQLQSFLESERRMSFPAVAQPRVSVVMLTWNQAHHTYMTLHSLLALETSVAFELIIVDNASHDDTAALLDRLDHVPIVRNETNTGFGPACNAGAALSRGDLICFLNNDTLSNSGWLDELVHMMDAYPNCGAAGAKLVLPDGRLQEAGSIIWRDGSTLGYGRGGNPDAPEYSYVREVDYCSAACLLIRKDLFDRVGGFDQRYAPAYYEDADLCMSVREAGYAVLFAPSAVITHLEHASSDRGAAIALQQRNRDVFVSKWRLRLADRPLPGVQEELWARDSRATRRVLVIDDRIPEARFGSGFPRTRALLEMLVELGYAVSYLPTADPTPVEPDTKVLQQLGIEVLHSVFDVSQRLRERRGLYDVAIVSRPTNVSFLPVVRQWNPAAQVIYDAEAVFTFREALQAQLAGTPFTPEQFDRRITDELAPLASADAVMTVSERERAAIEQHFPGKPVYVWGHPTSVKLESPSFAERRGALFVGYLASAPNHDALMQLLGPIIPEVYDEVGCPLTVIGSDAQPEALAAGAMLHHVVSFRGYVDTLDDVYDANRIFVAPHRFAAGVPLKVIEAMAHGLPCVISRLLAEQLGMTDELNALVASDSREFAAKMVQLYSDEAVWSAIQQNGFQYIRDRYDPDHMEARLREVIESQPISFGGTNATVAAASE